MPPETGELNIPPAGAVAQRVAGTAAITRVDTPLATTTISATVLFVDLRGYTGLAEQLPPAAVAGLLDEFFAVLAGATERHGGQVFSMVGDGMMAGFGLPGSGDAGANDAVGAAQSMLKGFAPVVARWRSELGIETGIGIGLHRGDVALCQHGTPGQRASTLVGDTVNVAARLCARARAGEVLFSAAVAAALDARPRQPGEAPGPQHCIHLPQFAVRGRVRPLDIWCMPAQQRLTI
jgi:class 3 adenylate cyclase